MGAAASFAGENTSDFEKFKAIRDEYESKVSSGATDKEIYDHVVSVINTFSPVFSLSQLAVSNDHNNCTEEIIKRAHLNLLSKEEHNIGKTNVLVRDAVLTEAKSFGWNEVAVPQLPCSVVTVTDNFDSLKVPKDHYSRLPSDVYYCDETFLLRTHLAAHIGHILKSGVRSFLMSGDVFRRIEEDEAQSELQHKLDFVCISDTELSSGDDSENAQEIYTAVAEKVVKRLIGEESKLRWEESDEAFHIIGEAYNDLQTKVGEGIIDIARGGMLATEYLSELGFESGWQGFTISFDIDHLCMILNSISSIREAQLPLASEED